MDIYWWLVLVVLYVIPGICTVIDNYHWVKRRIQRKQQIVVSDIFDFLMICCVVPLLPIINWQTVTDRFIVWFCKFEDKVIFKWDRK
jgi:hypothetical protein